MALPIRLCRQTDKVPVKRGSVNARESTKSRPAAATKRDETRRDETKRDETRHDKTERDGTTQDETSHPRHDLRPLIPTKLNLTNTR